MNIKCAVRLGMVLGLTALSALYSMQSIAAPCGGTSTWSFVVDEGVSSLFTDTDAAMRGTPCGLVVAPNNDALKRYVQDDSPASLGPDGAKRYRFRFYFDLNSIPLASDGSVVVKIAAFKTTKPDAPNPNLFMIKLRGTSTPGIYELRVWARKDASGAKSATSFFINDGPNVIEVKLTFRSGKGTLRVWVNNATQASPDYAVLNLDNAAYGGVDLLQLGFLGTNKGATVSGRMYFDEIVTRTTGFIGP